MPDPLPRNSKADENAEQIRQALERQNRPQFGGYQGIGRPPGAMPPRPAGAQAPRPNPFNAVPPGMGGVERLNRPIANPPAAPAPAAPRPVPQPAARPAPQQAQARPFSWRNIHWGWYVFLGVMILLSSDRNEQPVNVAPAQNDIALITLTQQPLASLVANAPESVTATMLRLEAVALPTSTPAACEITDLKSTVSSDPDLTAGGGIVFHIEVYSQHCLGIPLRIGVWLDSVNGERFFAPDAEPLYRLDNGQVTIQAKITPIEQAGMTVAQLSLPTTQLGLPSGSYRIEGYVNVRDWESGWALDSRSYPPTTITIP